MAKRKPSPPKPATCHPDKRDIGRGLCSACYFRQRREQTAAVLGKSKPARQFLEAAALEAPRDLAHAIAQASDELVLALPEAARALRRAIVEGDPDKGFSIKAAEAVLRGVPVASPGGLKRLLETPAKPAEGPPPAQVVIGLHVSAGDVKVGRVVGTLPAKVES